MTTVSDEGNARLSQVMRSNDKDVDRVVVTCCVAVSVVLLILYIYARMGGIGIADNVSVSAYILADEIMILAAVIIYCTVKQDAVWPRFVYIGVLMVTAMIISSVLSLSYLIFAIPIMLVTSYYNRRLTLLVAVIGALVMCLEPFVSVYMGQIDLNYCTLNPYNESIFIITSTPLEEAVVKLTNYVLPSLLIYVGMTILSAWVTTTGLSLVKDRTALVQSSIEMEHELNIASDIQLGMLPDDFPDTDSYAIRAVMKPAKDVGGDFYDFIKIGNSQIAFLVADVSGKGVPAALFMASARTLIRNNLKNGMTVDSVMDSTNAELVQSNKEKLFVTVWLGILDTSTGVLSYVNAGHNPPLMVHADGSIDNIVSKPNFVLGRKKGIRYKEHRIQLAPGDKLFLYTDGLTDSTDVSGQMFKEDRVKEVLSACKGADSIIPNMIDSVSSFSNGAEQFDDITMLLVDFKKLNVIEYSEGECFTANPEGHNKALDYIRSRLKECGCSEKVMRDMEVSASEIISNIDMYAYEGIDNGTIRISADVIDRIATVIFRDDGPEYNPLGRSNPDVEKRIKEHKIGGFGIFIVRKLMDDVRYERIDDQNVLTIMKEI